MSLGRFLFVCLFVLNVLAVTKRHSAGLKKTINSNSNYDIAMLSPSILLFTS